MFDGYQLLADSKFVGNSPNLGIGGTVKFKEDGKKIHKWFDRSHPTGSAEDFIDGLKINAEGPLHLRNVEFKDFYDEFKEAQSCNIRFSEEFRFLMGATSSVEGLSFDEDALRICSGGDAGIGSMTVHFRYPYYNDIEKYHTNWKLFFSDIDGSLSGTAGNTVIFNDPYVVPDTCEYNADWDMAVCPPELTFEAVNIITRLCHIWGHNAFYCIVLYVAKAGGAWRDSGCSGR